MKSIYVLFLSLVLAATPCFAGGANRNKHKQRQRSKPSAQQQAGPSAQQNVTGQQPEISQQALRAITNFQKQAEKDAENFLKNSTAKSITWGQFITNNRIESATASNVCGLFPLLTERLEMAAYKVGEPDWNMLLDTAPEGKKFLFLAEAFPFTQTAPNAVLSALRTLREQNPEKRILLASEFVQNKQGSSSFLYKHTSATSNLEDLYGMLPAVKTYKIDVLALNDNVITKKKQNFSVKVGNAEVQVRIAAEGAPSEYSDEDILPVTRAIKYSPYGLNKINEQWEQRINNVKGQYDIIVVYTTPDHTVSPAFSLLNVLGIPTAPIVILSPATQHMLPEKIEEQKQFFKNRNPQNESDFLQTKAHFEASKSAGEQSIYLDKINSLNQPIYQDVYPYSDQLRLYHAQQAANQGIRYQGEGTSLTGETMPDYAQILMHPFYAELNGASFTARLSGKQGYQIPANMGLPEGIVLFYHVGEVTLSGN